MTSIENKTKTMVNLTRRLLIGEGATPLPSSGADQLWLPGSGRLRVSGARTAEGITKQWQNMDRMPNPPLWRGLAYMRPKVSEPVVMMRVEQFGRLIALTEQALVESGRMSDF